MNSSKCEFKNQNNYLCEVSYMTTTNVAINTITTTILFICNSNLEYVYYARNFERFSGILQFFKVNIKLKYRSTC